MRSLLAVSSASSTRGSRLSRSRTSSPPPHRPSPCGRSTRSPSPPPHGDVPPLGTVELSQGVPTLGTEVLQALDKRTSPVFVVELHRTTDVAVVWHNVAFHNTYGPSEHADGWITRPCTARGVVTGPAVWVPLAQWVRCGVHALRAAFSSIRRSGEEDRDTSAASSPSSPSTQVLNALIATQARCDSSGQDLLDLNARTWLGTAQLAWWPRETCLCRCLVVTLHYPCNSDGAAPSSHVSISGDSSSALASLSGHLEKPVGSSGGETIFRRFRDLRVRSRDGDTEYAWCWGVPRARCDTPDRYPSPPPSPPIGFDFYRRAAYVWRCDPAVASHRPEEMLFDLEL